MRRVPSQSYVASPATWDHRVLPATRHKWMRPALTPATKLVLDLPIPEGWKADGGLQSLDHKSYALTTTPPSRHCLKVVVQTNLMDWGISVMPATRTLYVRLWKNTVRWWGINGERWTSNMSPSSTNLRQDFSSPSSRLPLKSNWSFLGLCPTPPKNLPKSIRNFLNNPVDRQTNRRGINITSWQWFNTLIPRSRTVSNVAYTVFVLSRLSAPVIPLQIQR